MCVDFYIRFSFFEVIGSDCQLFRMRSLIAWLFLSMYRDVITSDACPARRRQSSSDPPYRLMFRAAFVMKVRLPECEVHPTSPSDLYHPSTFDFPLKSTEILELRDARFRFPLASVITKSPAEPRPLSRSTTWSALNATRSAGWMGIFLPDLPFVASFVSASIKPRPGGWL